MCRFYEILLKISRIFGIGINLCQKTVPTNHLSENRRGPHEISIFNFSFFCNLKVKLKTIFIKERSDENEHV